MYSLLSTAQTEPVNPEHVMYGVSRPPVVITERFFLKQGYCWNIQ